MADPHLPPEEIEARLRERHTFWSRHKPLLPTLYSEAADAIADLRRQLEEARKLAEGERERAAQACEREEEAFRSPEYATGQPLSSVGERTACRCCAVAIRALPSPLSAEMSCQTQETCLRVQEGLIRLANDLRIDPWVRREIVDLIDLSALPHPAPAATTLSGTTSPSASCSIENAGYVAPAADTVAVPRKWLAKLTVVLREGYGDELDAAAAEITRLLGETP